MLYWLAYGRAHLKEEIAIRSALDFSVLPLQTEFGEFLQNEANNGRILYLATASDRRLAEPVANRLGIFKQVLASNGRHNLKGKQKLEAILACCNGLEFDYAGNQRVDLAIWAKARRVLTRKWQDVLADKSLKDLPYKIEINEYGKIEMSPASVIHSLLQGMIAFELRNQFNDEVFAELAVQTRKGVKVPDVGWVSSYTPDNIVMNCVRLRRRKFAWGSFRLPIP